MSKNHPKSVKIKDGQFKEIYSIENLLNSKTTLPKMLGKQYADYSFKISFYQDFNEVIVNRVVHFISPCWCEFNMYGFN
jgi:hypothetical protein